MTPDENRGGAASAPGDEPRTYYKARANQGQWLILPSLKDLEEYVEGHGEDPEEYEIATTTMRPSEFKKLGEWIGW